MPKRTIQRLPVVFGVLVCLAGPAVAQTPATLPVDGAGWMPILVGAGLAVVILITAFLNPKRSHSRK